MSVQTPIRSTHLKHLDRVRRYYEQNTHWFRALGNDRAMHTIHRAVWAETVTDLQGALNYSGQLILDEIRVYEQAYPARSLTILDAGCGVGGSVFYLAQHLPTSARLIGLTLSSTQARMARHAARRLRQRPAGMFIEGDFLNLPLNEAVDLAFSIEAFAHASDPARFFERVAWALKPGGRLMILDDFVSEGPTPSAGFDWVSAFRQGWHLPRLAPASQSIQLAQRVGLRVRTNLDLTPYLRLRPLPDRLARGVWRLAQPWQKHFPILSSLLGSLAQQNAFQHQRLNYRWLVFERRG